MFSTSFITHPELKNASSSKKLLSDKSFSYSTMRRSGEDSFPVQGYSTPLTLSSGADARIIVERQYGLGLSIEVLPLVRDTETEDARAATCYLQRHLIMDGLPPLRKIAKLVAERCRQCSCPAATASVVEQILLEFQKKNTHGCPRVSIVDAPLKSA